MILLLSCDVSDNTEIENVDSVSNQTINQKIVSDLITGNFQDEKVVYNMLNSSEKHYIWNNNLSVLIKDTRFNEEQIKDEAIEIEENDDVDLNTMLSMIQQLPDRYRMVFSMYVLDDYSHKEIANMMNITVGTSKSNLARARQQLKTTIIQWRNEQNSNAS